MKPISCAHKNAQENFNAHTQQWSEKEIHEKTATRKTSLIIRKTSAIIRKRVQSQNVLVLDMSIMTARTAGASKILACNFVQSLWVYTWRPK